MSGQSLFYLGFALIFVGLGIVFVAALLLFLASTKKGGKVRGGGAIIIGPFPIVFGTDKESVKLLLVLSLALITLLLVGVAYYHYAFM